MITPVPPAYTISKANHFSVPKELVPGPTDYDPYKINVRSSVPCYSFAKSPRKLHEPHEIPGPGLYETGQKANSPGFSMSKSPRILSNVRYLSPGPGDYDYNKMQERYKFSISKARNSSCHISESPGPGYYSPNSTVSIENSPRTKFNKQPRMADHAFLTPAPGQYFISNLPNAKGFTIPKALPKIKFPVSPGPGFYHCDTNTIGIALNKGH